MIKKTLRVGVVGGNSWLVNMYRRTLASIGIKVVAIVASGNPDEAIEKGQKCPNLAGVKLYRTVEEMIEGESELHFVLVCSRNDAHLAQFSAIVQAGIPLAGEKPAFQTLSEMQQFDQLLADQPKSLPILSCHMYPFHRVMQTIKWLLTNRLDLIGQPWGWESSYLQDWLANPADQTNWRLIPSEDPVLAAQQGNAIVDIQSHQHALSHELGFVLKSVDHARRWNTFNPKLLETNVRTAATMEFGGKEVRADLTTDQTRIGHKNDVGFTVSCANSTITWRQEHPEDATINFGNGSFGEVKIYRGQLPEGIFGKSPAELGGDIPPGHPEGLPSASAYAFSAFEADVRTYWDGLYEKPSPGYFNYQGAREIMGGNAATIRSCNDGVKVSLV